MIDLGAKRVRFIDTPHTPHGWDAGVLYEETTGTLLCGDLFTQLGDGPALTTGDVVGPAIAGEDLFHYASLNPGMGATLRLAALAPKTLALMHGPSFVGDAPPPSGRWPTNTTAASPARWPTSSLPPDLESARPDAPGACSCEPRRVRGPHDPRPSSERGDRPRRTPETPRRHILIRRERTSEGWPLHFTGGEAHARPIQDGFDEIEPIFSLG